MNATSASATPPPDWVRHARRDSEDPILGGVASGLAHHLAIDVKWVRVAFVVTAFLSGFGVFVYAALWAFLPAEPLYREEAPGLESARRGGRRPGRVRRLADAGPTLAACALAMGALLLIDVTFGAGAWIWPLVIGFAGLALLWRQADEAQRVRWNNPSGPLRTVFGGGTLADYGRVALGGLLLLTAMLLFTWRSGQGAITRDVFGAVLLAVLGLLLVIAPWVLRLVADLGSEREQRVRSEERADMAAHLHDSVLQTLALIQKNAADPAMVARLARAQERDLRRWLFDESGADETTLVGALREADARVEDEYGVVVDLVAVGDAPLDERLRPLAQAAAEAVVNAAKHAGTPRIDVFLEVTEELVEVFVRDRGVGFDPDAVADDRHGVKHSIVDRMERHGGRALIRSAPGEGTEVRLAMPLDAVSVAPQKSEKQAP